MVAEPAHVVARNALLAHLAAREAFWARAAAEGWTPRADTTRRNKPVPCGTEGIPAAFRYEGSEPGLWPPEARASAEWRRWHRLRGKAFDSMGGLVTTLARRRSIGYRPEDREDILQAARTKALRGVDLWDPARAVRPGTYIGRWVCQGIGAEKKRIGRDIAETDSYSDREEVVTDRAEAGPWAEQDAWAEVLDFDADLLLEELFRRPGGRL